MTVAAHLNTADSQAIMPSRGDTGRYSELARREAQAFQKLFDSDVHYSGSGSQTLLAKPVVAGFPQTHVMSHVEAHLPKAESLSVPAREVLRSIPQGAQGFSAVQRGVPVMGQPVALAPSQQPVADHRVTSQLRVFAQMPQIAPRYQWSSVAVHVLGGHADLQLTIRNAAWTTLPDGVARRLREMVENGGQKLGSIFLNGSPAWKSPDSPDKDA